MAKAKICWRSRHTAATGCGSFINVNAAVDAILRARREWGRDIVHWLVYQQVFNKEKKMSIDSGKTYAVQKSTLEAIGIELLIAQREYEKQLNMHTHLITGKCELFEADEVFYKSQIEYLAKLVSKLDEITNNELLLI